VGIWLLSPRRRAERDEPLGIKLSPGRSGELVLCLSAPAAMQLTHRGQIAVNEVRVSALAPLRPSKARDVFQLQARIRDACADEQLVRLMEHTVLVKHPP